jgi:hypothetical protein
MHLPPSLESLLHTLADVLIVLSALASIVGVGYVAIRAVNFALRGRRPYMLRPVGVAFQFVIGLRLATFIGQSLSALGLAFVPWVILAGAVGLAGCALIVRDFLVGSAGLRFPRSTFALMAVLFFGAIVAASAFSPPCAWDGYTHWLLVPHEILSGNSLLAQNAGTNSVAPEYALHQTWVVAALLLAGVPDGRVAILNVMFVAGACVATAVAMVLLRIDRTTRAAAALLVAALLTAYDLTFGFAYGDALLIFTLALCALGVLWTPRQRDWRRIALAALLITSPVAAKGSGHLIAAAVCVALVGLAAVSSLSGPPRLRKVVRDPQLAVGVLGLTIVALERHLLYRLTFHPPESNTVLAADAAAARLRELGPVALLSRLPVMFAGWENVLYVTFALLAGVCLALRWAGRRYPSSYWPQFLLPGMAAFLVLLSGVLTVPELVAGLPRYSFEFVPTVVLGTVTIGRLVARRRGGRYILRVALVLAAVVTFVKGDLPRYVRSYLPTMARHLVSRTATDPEAPAFGPDLQRLSQVNPEITRRSTKYLLVSERVDGYLSYRVMFHLVVNGYRGHLYSDANTSRTGDKGLRAQVAREALLAGDPVALREALEGIDLVLLNPAETALGSEHRWVFPSREFLGLAAARLSRVQ